MDRSVDIVVTRAREKLEPLLSRRGYSLRAEYLSPAAFGSVHSEYGNRTHRIELAWDGKDRWLWLKVGRVEKDGEPVPLRWQDLESVLGLTAAGQWLRAGVVADERIRSLAGALQTFLDHDPAI